MKPFLGIDLTNDKNNEQFNGEELMTAKPSLAMAQAFEASSDKANETIHRSKLPLALRIVQWICGGIGIIIAFGLLNALSSDDGTTFKTAYRNAPWLFWLAGFCLLAWLILKLVSIRKEKTVLESEESTHVLSNLEGISNGIFTELSVPADAPEVDLLSFFYKIKNDGLHVCQKGLQLAPYFNPVFRIYADSENLYLANLEGKYTIPLYALQAIHTVDKNIGIASWNKDESPDAGRYKPYKISMDSNECIHCKPYHILEFFLNGQTWGIYFPCYELPIFESVTGFQAT